MTEGLTAGFIHSWGRLQSTSELDLQGLLILSSFCGANSANSIRLAIKTAFLACSGRDTVSRSISGVLDSR